MFPPRDDEGGSRPRAQTLVCPGCARPVSAQAEFCPRCGAPLGPYCWWDPWKRIFSTGYVARRLASGPVGGFAAATAAALAALGMLAFFSGLRDVAREGRPAKGEDWFGAVFALAGALALMVFLRRVLLNLLRRRADNKP